MRIAVVDDESPSRSELVYLLNECMPDAIISEADCGASALDLFSRETFNMVFLDIQLGDITGTTLAINVKKIMPSAHIVFATAYAQYAVQAFELGAADYILKPFDQSQVERVLEKYRGNLRAPSQEVLPSKLPLNKLALTCDRKIVLLDIDNIDYIETSQRGCIIHTRNGDFTDSNCIKKYSEKLVEPRFFRIHKSYLVNLDQVEEIFPWHNNGFALKISGYNAALPIGREKIKNLKRIFNI